jgi:hypothetical protein
MDEKRAVQGGNPFKKLTFRGRVAQDFTCFGINVGYQFFPLRIRAFDLYKIIFVDRQLADFRVLFPEQRERLRECGFTETFGAVG